MKQAVGVYGPDTLEALRQSFAASDFHVRKLLVEIATIAASRGLPDAAPESRRSHCTPAAQPNRNAPP